MFLDIVLRTSYKKGVATHLTRIGNITNRGELILKCFKSLATAISNYTGDYKFTVLDDHSGDDFKKAITRILEDSNIKSYNIVDLQQTGFNYSAYEQFRFGKDLAKELVYFVEDDYLHAPDAISAMMSAYEVFDRISGFNPVAIYPYDSIGMYLPDRMSPTRLFSLDNRLWRGTLMTGNTMFIHSEHVRKYWQLFETLALQYNNNPNITEDTTINQLWNNTVDIRGPICLFSPIPSCAIHVSYHEPIPLSTHLQDWKKDYDAIEVKLI
jgi:hypothetical protein